MEILNQTETIISDPICEITAVRKEYYITGALDIDVNVNVICPNFYHLTIVFLCLTEHKILLLYRDFPRPYPWFELPDTRSTNNCLFDCLFVSLIGLGLQGTHSGPNFINLRSS